MFKILKNKYWEWHEEKTQFVKAACNNRHLGDTPLVHCILMLTFQINHTHAHFNDEEMRIRENK